MPDIEPLEGKALRASVPPPGASIVVFEGAVRSSKSVTVDLMWLSFIRNGPEGALAMIGRTETTIINNVVIPLQEMLGTSRVVLNRGTGTVNILGREVRLFGANDAQAYTKIQGMTLAGAYVDEAAVIAESFWNMLRSRLSVPGAMLYATCNPEGPKHWLLVKWLKRAQWWLDRDGAWHEYEEYDEHGAPKHMPLYRVTFLLEDNHWLARNNPEFVRQLMTSWPPGSVFHRRYIRSEWVSAEGVIYGMWDERRHATLTPEKAHACGARALMIAVDYGSTHATRGYLLGLATIDGVTRLVVLDEFAPPSATVGEHGRLFQSWLMGAQREWGEVEWIAVDPAAKTFRLELIERGIDNVMKAHNSVLSGIQTVQSVLYSGHLLVVGARCPYLVGAVDGYMWDTKATERGTTAPVKENDDEVDALRYVVYTSRRYWRDLIPLAPISTDDEEEQAA